MQILKDMLESEKNVHEFSDERIRDFYRIAQDLTKEIITKGIDLIKK